MRSEPATLTAGALRQALARARDDMPVVISTPERDLWRPAGAVVECTEAAVVVLGWDEQPAECDRVLWPVEESGG